MRLYIPVPVLQYTTQNNSGHNWTIALVHIWCHFNFLDRHSLLFLLIPVFWHIFVAGLVLKSIIVFSWSELT